VTSLNVADDVSTLAKCGSFADGHLTFFGRGRVHGEPAPLIPAGPPDRLLYQREKREAGVRGIRFGRSLMLGVMLGLAGCAASGGGGGAPAPDILSWQGQSAAALQQGLGPPDAVDKLPSGETVMTYRWSNSQIYGGYAVSMGGYSQLGTQYVPTQVVSMNCQARFTIGADDRVRDIAFQGNGCLQEHR